MSSQQQPLSIRGSGWQNGIGESPFTGFGLLKCADINSYPGAVKVVKKPVSLFFAGTARTFTADAGTDICTASGNLESGGLAYDGMAVTFTTSGTLPAGLAINTIYYLIRVTDSTFKVATSYKNSAGSAAGTAINITDAGSGTHTVTPLTIGTINWIIRDITTGIYYMQDSRGRIWFASSLRAYLLNNSAIDTGGSSVTNASGNGIVLFKVSNSSKTYLLSFRNALIDVLEVTNETAYEALTWSNAWQTMNTGASTSNTHHAIVGQDDAIYYCDGRYIGSIIENSGSVFDPTNSATFTYNSQALDLPQNEIAQCLEELGTNLLIGGNTYNKIYPWDRISDSFELPISVPETSIKRMKNIGEVIYILAGTWGNIYKTQGSYISSDVKKIPTYITNNSDDVITNPITWGGIANGNSDLLFGVNGNDTGSDGIYRLSTSGVLTFDNIPPSGSSNVTAIYSAGDFYIFGYDGGAASFQGARYDNFETVIQSALHIVGNKTHKAAYSQMEVILAKNRDGDLRVKYRENTSSNTAFSDFPGGAVLLDGSGSSFTFDIGLTDLEKIQVQIEMDGKNELLDVILYP